MYWGPPTWTFLHTLAEKIKESEFVNIKQQLIFNIILICKNLPCPDCTQHATHFWTHVVNLSTIVKKQDLINVLYSFHNMVNARKRYKRYRFEQMNVYNKKHLIATFNEFMKHFHTKGNMNQINESFHRQKALRQIKTWLMTNASKFDLQ